MIAKGMFTSNTCEWATPEYLFKQIADSYGPFDLDVCATAENAKCARYFTREQDGLMRDWKGRVWMNPPYGREIGAWVRKACMSAEVGDATVVALLPSRTDTAWWHNSVLLGHAEVRFIYGRVRFTGGKNSAPFGSAIVVWRPPLFAARKHGREQ